MSHVTHSPFVGFFNSNPKIEVPPGNFSAYCTIFRRENRTSLDLSFVFIRDPAPIKNGPKTRLKLKKASTCCYLTDTAGLKDTYQCFKRLELIIFKIETYSIYLLSSCAFLWKITRSWGKCIILKDFDVLCFHPESRFLFILSKCVGYNWLPKSFMQISCSSL